MTPPNIAPAIIELKTKKIISSFIESGALSPHQAKTPEELNLSRGMILNRLIRMGVLVETRYERFYLDTEKLTQYEAGKKKRILSAMGLILFMLIMLILFSLLNP